MIIFKERLKELRTKKKMLQRDVAKYLNVTVRTYQYYESGELEPSLEKLVKIADLFEVSTDFLLGRENTEALKEK